MSEANQEPDVASSRSSNDLDTDEPQEDSRETEEIRAELEEFVNEYDDEDSRGDPSDKELERLYELLGYIEDETFSRYRNAIARITGKRDRTLRRYRHLMQHLVENGPILQDGAMYRIQWGSQGVRTDRIANFEIQVDSFLQFDDNTRIIQAMVIPESEPEYQVVIKPKVFNRVTTFENHVVTGFTTRFDGSGPQQKKADLNDLRETLFQQDAPLRHGTRLMGLHGDEFVVPTGVLDNEDWKADPDRVYVEDDTNAVAVLIEPGDEYNQEHVAELIELLPKIRSTDRIIPILGWFYAAPLRPLILDWVDHFPVLSVHGETESGKTSTGKIPMELFGIEPEPLGIGTNFAQLAAFSTSNAIPIWFDEYKPTVINNRRLNAFHTRIRKSTSGGAIEQRGNADQSTTSYRLEAPVFVTGEQRFQESPERRRSIMVQFKQESTNDGTETAKNYAKLTGRVYRDASGQQYTYPGFDLSQHAVAYYPFVLSQEKDDLHQLWEEAAETTLTVVNTNNLSGLGDTELQNLRVNVFGWQLCRKFGTKVGANLDELPTEADLHDALVHVGEQYGTKGRRKNYTDDFIELVARAAADDYLEEEEQYGFIKDDTVLRFNLKDCYDKVRQYRMHHDLDEQLLNREAYRDRFKELTADDGSYVEAYSQNTVGLNRCIGIYFEEAADKLNISEDQFHDISGF